MELLNQFKTFLITSKNKRSKATIKNYQSDVRKFINWVEGHYNVTFSPTLISAKIIDEYTNSLTNNNTPLHASPRSKERYLSSLRKFLQFLQEKNIITTNPLQNNQKNTKDISDPWFLKEFDQYLYTQKAARLTIKNYLLDIKQFLTWTTQVLPQNERAPQELLSHITSLVIDEYKDRLLSQAHMSPVSVNRKLSSLRRYFNWISQKETLKDLGQLRNLANLPLNENKHAELPYSSSLADYVSEQITVSTPEMNSQTTTISPYSSFGPLRFFQRIAKGLNAAIETTTIAPFAKLIETTGYLYWKLKGGDIFQPLDKIESGKIDSLPNQINPINSEKNTGTHITYIDKKATSLREKLRHILTISQPVQTVRITSIPKEVYAPLKISTKGFPLHKKILHHLRHSRPKWYRRYRNTTISNYLNFAMLLIFLIAAGIGFYRAFIENPAKQKPVIAALPTAPPRILSFQARLTDALNNPITAETPLRFSIYNDPTASGTALLWQENQNIAPDTDGVFSTTLGKNTHIPSTLFAQNGSLYLGVSVGGDQELQPRQQLATVAYASNAETLQGLKPITQSDAGTSNVILALDSAGNLTIGGSASPTFQATGGNFTLSGKTLTLTTAVGTNTNVQISPDGQGVIDAQKPLQNTTNNNNLPLAQGAVEIDDIFAILATSSAQAALTLQQDGTGPLIMASSSGTSKFTVSNLGAGMFASDLAINGSNLTTTSTTFNLANTNAINLNIGGAATAISIGASSGNTTINNTLLANNGLTVASGKSLIVSGNVASSLIPSASGTYDLGSSANYWNNLYVNNLYTNPAATVNGFWQRNSGALSPANSTDSFLIGGSATGSASFQVNNNISLPTVGISGSSNIAALLVNNTEGGALFTASASGVAKFSIDTTGNARVANSLCVKADLSTACSGTTAGTIYATNTTIQSADLAENYISSQQLEPGDIVQFAKDGNAFSISKSNARQQEDLVGIISTQPGITLNSDAKTDSEHPYVYPLALKGRVPTKVSTENGPIHKGDMLTSSSIPGVAMKATQPGMVIAKALEEYNTTDTRTIGKIETFVTLTWFTPQAQLTQTGDLPQAMQNVTQNETPANSLEQIIQNIAAGLLQTRTIITDSLAITTENISIGSQTLRQYITAIVEEVLDKKLKNQPEQFALQSPIRTNTHEENQLPSPALATDSAALLSSSSATTASPAATYITNITNIYNSTPSATASIEATPTPPSNNLANTPDTIATSEANTLLADTNLPLPTDFANISSLSGLLDNSQLNFNHASSPNLADLSIAGQLSVGATMILSDNAINTVGTDLQIQPLRQGNIQIMGGLVKIDTSGNLTVAGDTAFGRDVSIKGKLTASLIAPVPDTDLIIKLPQTDSQKQGSSLAVQNASGSSILKLDQFGNLIASGSGNFAKLATQALNIVKGAQADTSLTETVASSSAGTALITANESERTIYTPFVTKDSLIYLTATSDTQGLTPYVARQTEANPKTNTKASFTIQIPYPTSKNIKINWWIIN
jgi:site-specific recombinase XerD